MKHHILTAFLLTGTILQAGHAQGATLDLMTTAPNLSSSTSIIDYLEFGPDGDLSTSGAVVDFTDGVFPTGLTEIGLGIGFALADPSTGATGGFDVFDAAGLFLTGDLQKVGFTDNLIELLFGSLGGAGAGSFGPSVLVSIAVDDPLGADPFAALVDGDSLGASITIANVAAIPLPASLPLLVASNGGLFFLRRRGGRGSAGAQGPSHTATAFA